MPPRDRAERLALGLGVLLLHDLAGRRRQLAEQPVVGLLEVDGEGLVAGGLDRLHPVEDLRRSSRRPWGSCARSRLKTASCGRDRGAVPELRVGVHREVVLGRRRASVYVARPGPSVMVRRLAQQRVAQQRVDGVLGVVEAPGSGPGSGSRGRSPRPRRRRRTSASGSAPCSPVVAWLALLAGRLGSAGGQRQGAGERTGAENRPASCWVLGHGRVPSSGVGEGEVGRVRGTGRQEGSGHRPSSRSAAAPTWKAVTSS